MKPETLRSGAWALGATVLLGALIVTGSRNLAHFDAALVAYTFSVLFATFGLAAAATAGEQRKPRTATVQGRQLVWHEAKTEKPYALRGDEARDRKVEKPRIELQSHGRQGTDVKINRADD